MGREGGGQGSCGFTCPPPKTHLNSQSPWRCTAWGRRMRFSARTLRGVCVGCPPHHFCGRKQQVIRKTVEPASSSPWVHSFPSSLECLFLKGQSAGAFSCALLSPVMVIYIVKWTGFGISWETHLWLCLQGCLQRGLTEVGGTPSCVWAASSCRLGSCTQAAFHHQTPSTEPATCSELPRAILVPVHHDAHF